jgi:HD-GYP domain-containing protein (c-di-GMP phosphodiesterase class II)
VRDVFIGALLHDIGKLVIPSAIIGKASTLTDEEFATIRTHPEQGERLLAHAPTLAGAARYVRWHHERPDGTGYPDGLRGHEIPLEVSIVSAADAWDAMTNTRQYRTAMSAERAREILLAGAGTQWRAEAVRHLLEVVDRDDLATSLPQRAGPVATEPTESTIECALEHRP